MRDNPDAVHIIIAAALIEWSVWNIGLLRKPGGSRSQWLLLTSLGAGEAIRYQSVHRWTDTRYGPGWDMIAYHSAYIIAVASAIDLMHVVLRNPSRSRRRARAVAGLAVLAAALPWTIDAPLAVHPTLALVPDYYDAGWQTVAHTAVMAAYLGWAELTLVRHSLRQARLILTSQRSDRYRISRGIHITATGVIMGLICLAGHDILEILWALHHGETIPAITYNILDAVTLGPGALLVAVGLVWHFVGDALLSHREARLSRATERKLALLHPHWSWLVDALPEMTAFPESMVGRARTAEEVQFRFTRMTTEIYDATRLVMSRVPRETYATFNERAQALGLGAEAARAVSRNLCLRSALDGRWSQTAPVRSMPVSDMTTAHLIADLRCLRRRRPRAVLHAILHEESR